MFAVAPAAPNSTGLRPAGLLRLLRLRGPRSSSLALGFQWRRAVALKAAVLLEKASSRFSESALESR